MNKLKPLLLLGGAVLIYSAIQAAKFVKNFTVQFYNLNIGGSLLEPKVYATLKLNNKENFSITVSDIEGKLYYQNKFISNIAMPSSVEILPNEVVYFDIQLSSMLPDVLQFISNFIKTKKINNQIYFDGSVKLNGIKIPYKSYLNW